MSAFALAVRHDGISIADSEIRPLRAKLGESGRGMTEVIRPLPGLVVLVWHDPAFEEPPPRLVGRQGCVTVVNAGRSPALSPDRIGGYLRGAPAVVDLGWPFLVASWDAESLTVLTDPLAGRAAWYATSGPTTVIASQPSLVMAHPDVSLEPDMGIIAERLINRPTTPYRTVYRDLSAVPAGSRLTIAGRRRRLTRWHEWDVDVSADTSLDAWTDRVFRQTSDVIAGHLRHASPDTAAVWLSGGLDSSAVAGVVRHLGLDDRVRVVARRYPGLPCDEGEYQDAVVDGTRFIRHEISHRELDPERDIVEPIRSRAVPLSGVSPEVTDSLRWCQSNGWHRSITGVGGDEMFLPLPSPTLGEQSPRPLRIARRRRRMQPWIDPRFARRVGLASRQELRRESRRTSVHARRRLEHFVGDGWWSIGAEEFEHHRREFGHEPFDVFRHPDLVQLALHMPETVRSSVDDRRSIQRVAFSPVLPKRLIDRRSKVHFDYRHAIDLGHPWVRDRLSDLVLERDGLVDGGVVRSVHAELMTAVERDLASIPPLAKRLWFIVCMEEWWRERFG